jgi:response regulator RpfG family c-di-GMP phosphodiesterase
MQRRERGAKVRLMAPDPTPVSALGSSWKAATGRTRILVMEDQPEVHRTLDDALGERYSYEFASCVEQAREKLSAAPFHLAFCEIQTQSEFGFALVEEIIREYPETAIVLITRLDDPEVADRAFGLEVSGYLVRPFLARQLLITMMNVLRQRDIAVEKQAEARRDMAAKIALTHHERWDGNGYPLGLNGEGIPLEGRIVAVVDVFDSLLSGRCHWPAMSVDAVAATIREGRGSQFDPQIVDALLNHLDEALRLRSVHP